MNQEKTVVQSVNALPMLFKFNNDELNAHRSANHDITATEANVLKATVTRFWCDGDQPMRQTDVKVESPFRFIITGISDENTFGHRYIVTFIAVEPLVMETGLITKGPIQDGEQTYSPEPHGIDAFTTGRAFVDCDAGRGAILSYELPDNIEIELATPEGMDINRNPAPVIPYNLREIVKESTFRDPSDPVDSGNTGGTSGTGSSD